MAKMAHTTAFDLHILILDFLDSYTHNIPAFLREASPTELGISFDIRPYSDLNPNDVPAIADAYHGVMLSAGPGTVENALDLGDFAPALLAHRPAVPIYGICLGFQAICQHFGGAIKPLSPPHHGVVRQILDCDHNGLGRRATQYHSLEVTLSELAQQALEVQAVSEKENGGFCIMEIRHRSLPFWGVQYHPESVYSHGCHTTAWDFLAAASRRKPTWSLHDKIRRPFTPASLKSRTGTCTDDIGPSHPQNVLWERLNLSFDLLRLAENAESKDFILLDSGGKGDWDILTNDIRPKRVQYSLRNREFLENITDEAGHQNSGTKLLEEVWEWLENFSSTHDYHNGPENVPFWGGFIGYFGYELGLAQIDICPYSGSKKSGEPMIGTQAVRSVPDDSDRDDPDMYLLWSTETLLYHRPTQSVYLISLTQDVAWLEQTKSQIQSLASSTSSPKIAPPSTTIYNIINPEKQQYLRQIHQCQEHINAGNSYELCLTAQTRVSPSPASAHPSPGTTTPPTTLFHNMRTQNPANYMSLLHLPHLTFLSASPELFLEYDPTTRLARMKPIKGTHPKPTPTPPNHHPTPLAAAESALRTPKTTAENLMIVDLIRNDLHKLSSRVTCPQLMAIEELPTLHQLVSTIEAVTDDDDDGTTTAWDLLRATLPPGSMTGAPKRRSCELLRRIEGGNSQPRGLYSGVVGYVDVRGRAAFAVSIRNAVRRRGESTWRAGGGGAVTALSDPEAEWAERLAKVDSVLGAFAPGFEVLETVLWDPVAGLRFWEEHVARLNEAVGFFGFGAPQECASAEGLAEWVRERLGCEERGRFLRLSITADYRGDMGLRCIEIPDPAVAGGGGGGGGRGDVRVKLDPMSIDYAALEPFMTRKTTWREPYNMARDRTGVQGKDEALLFRPGDGEGDSKCEVDREGRRRAMEGYERPGRDDDILTEGSYTNVAVWREAEGKWVTPGKGCFKGIKREEMLFNKDIVPGRVTRNEIKDGMAVRLFNSVRGEFRGVVVR